MYIYCFEDKDCILFLILAASTESSLLLSTSDCWSHQHRARKWGNLEEVSDVSSGTQHEGNVGPPAPVGDARAQPQNTHSHTHKHTHARSHKLYV